MRTYEGHRDESKRAVVTVSINGRKPRTLSPKRSLSVRNHSPDGFNWGYAGSGPAQLSLAILLDLYPERGRDWAQTVYQEFKAQVIAGLGETWTLTTADIDRVVGQIEKTRQETTARASS